MPPQVRRGDPARQRVPQRLGPRAVEFRPFHPRGVRRRRRPTSAARHRPDVRSQGRLLGWPFVWPGGVVWVMAATRHCVLGG